MRLAIAAMLFLLTGIGFACSKSQENGATTATPTPSVSIEILPTPTPPKKITIHEAAKQRDFVIFRATGQDLDVVNLEVTATQTGFEFVIPAGTLLMNASTGHQNMMVARSVVVSFKDDWQPLTQNVQLEVYCVNLYKDVPTTNNVFTVGSYQPQSALVKFVQCLEKSDEEKDLRQQAVWIMSDNPTWEQFITRDRIDMIFSRDMFRDLLQNLSGETPTEAQLDAVIAEYRNLPDAELREQVKPFVTPHLVRARKLFMNCNASIEGRHLFGELPS